MTLNLWRRLLMPTSISICGMKLTRENCSHRGSNQLTLSHLHCWCINGVKVIRISMFRSLYFICSSAVSWIVFIQRTPFQEHRKNAWLDRSRSDNITCYDLKTRIGYIIIYRKWILLSLLCAVWQEWLECHAWGHLQYRSFLARTIYKPCFKHFLKKIGQH